MQGIQEQQRGPTMIAPPPGFTARVMGRIRDRERARARWRGIAGVGLLVVVVSGLMAWIGLGLAAMVAGFLAGPNAIGPVVLALSPSVLLIKAVLEAIWVAADGIQMLVYAGLVLVITLVWARVVIGPFQRPLGKAVGGV